MIRPLLSWVEWLIRIGICQRPDFLTVFVEDTPDEDELVGGLLFCEIREGYLKWAHFPCPRCNEHIRVPIAGTRDWTLVVDLLLRPTLQPSIWQTGSCGAHFFVRRGSIIWCQDDIRGRSHTTK